MLVTFKICVHYHSSPTLRTSKVHTTYQRKLSFEILHKKCCLLHTLLRNDIEIYKVEPEVIVLVLEPCSYSYILKSSRFILTMGFSLPPRVTSHPSLS